jgi:hypothetical protein
MSQSDFSEVRGNYLVERVPVADGQLIYTDEGASFLRFEENVCNGYSGMHRILSRGRASRGNTFCNGFLAGYKDFVPTKWDPDCYVANNVQLRRSAERPLEEKEFPAAAQAIIDKAGLEPAYRDLLDAVKTER